MKPFEWVFMAGLDQGPGQVNCIPISGKQYNEDEKKIISEYLELYVKESKATGAPLDLINVFVGAFLTGIGHAGTHFKEELRPGSSK
jgi:hypothetical protein